MKRGYLGSAALLLATATVLAACGGGKDSGSGSSGGASGQPGNSTPGKEAPTAISILVTFNTTEPPGADNVVVKEVEKRTNTALKINWVSGNSYGDKLNVTLASGDIPDLTLVIDPFASNIQQLIKDGAIWDLTPYIKDYKNLNAIPAQVWDGLKMGGKSYGIPRVRPLMNGGLLIRKDWIAKLGLPVPEDMDQLFTTLKAFAEKDPDGNGKNDTFGISETGTGFVSLAHNVFNGSNGQWKLKDGKLVDTELEPGTKLAIEWLKKVYDAKLIPPDFAVMQGSQSEDVVRSGGAGAIGGNYMGSWLIGEKQYKSVKADLSALPYLKSPDGTKVALPGSGSYGMFVIPKSVPEAKLKKVLAFMDYGASQEGSDLGNYGFEGVHYNVVDGFKVATEQATKDIVAQQAFGQIYAYYDKYLKAYATGIPGDMYQNNKKIIDEAAKYAISDPKFGLVSPTELQVGGDYKKKISDLKIQIIMGKQPLSAWDDMVAKLKADAQYQKIIAEVNDAYKAKMGK
ncbi:extracellular solute-binding protein [Paenibacillus cymbidii]|uniref:extracellular solute-binding protein n=1 Tax=Paenibacillus cymbidii TaxID=1639034 RepID=UPI0010817538|nr:extracellular solute-binding protein [Paenibacillus cymbidii]